MPPNTGTVEEERALHEKEVAAQNGGTSASGREATPSEGDSEAERGTWTNKLDFIMSALSFAVGMGNIWRFPYLCYRNGGGAFLIPYVVMVIFAGIPLIFLEMSLGQYGSLGVVSIWRACPLFQGIGWTMFCISLFSCIYYNMLIAYSFYYTFASFAKDVPWRTCDNWWNTEACGVVHALFDERNCTVNNGTWYNSTCVTVETVGQELFDNYTQMANISKQNLPEPKSATDEYFHRNMLSISDGIEDLGGVQWPLALCLLLCWALVALGLSTGVKSLGKATYVTSIFPYVILFILLIRAITLDGSTDGILYYLTPQWDRLASAKVWGDAAVQVFFSMSCCWGGLITLASYNKFNNNCLRDALIVAIGDTLTAIFAGIVIFGIIGYMAHELQVPIEKVATQGAGLAFIVYPEVVTRLPVSPLWSILFMLMLVNLGIGTQFTLVTTAHTTLLDVFSTTLRRGKRPLLLLLAICSGCYLVGLVICTRGGMYVLQLLDSYAPSYALLVLGIMECFALQYVYGHKRFMKNIEEMIGVKQSKFWIACWKYITPTLIVFILIFTFVDFKRSSYGDYTFPEWADGIGWIISLFEIGCVPGVAIYLICTKHRDQPIIQRIKTLCQPTEEWGPALENRGGDPAEWRLPLAKDEVKAQELEMTDREPVV